MVRLSLIWEMILTLYIMQGNIPWRGWALSSFLRAWRFPALLWMRVVDIPPPKQTCRRPIQEIPLPCTDESHLHVPLYVRKKALDHIFGMARDSIEKESLADLPGCFPTTDVDLYGREPDHRTQSEYCTAALGTDYARRWLLGSGIRWMAMSFAVESPLSLPIETDLALVGHSESLCPQPADGCRSINLLSDRSWLGMIFLL